MKHGMRMALLALAWTGPLAAAQQDFAAGEQVAPWLSLSDNARFTGMGEAGVALASGVGSATVNPAGLASVGGEELAFMHRSYVADSSFEHLAYGMALRPGLVVSAAFDYMSFGQLDAYAINGSGALVSAGSFSPGGWNGTLGVGYALGQAKLGCNLKWVSQAVDGGSSSGTVAGDLGALWKQADGGFSLGLSLLNAGGTLDGASLPMTTRLGGAYAFSLAFKDALSLALDADLPAVAAEAVSYSAGLEYQSHQPWVLRVGYKGVGNGGQGGLSLGAGAVVGLFNVDYAYSSLGVLGSAHQFSVSVKL